MAWNSIQEINLWKNNKTIMKTWFNFNLSTNTEYKSINLKMHKQIFWNDKNSLHHGIIIVKTRIKTRDMPLLIVSIWFVLINIFQFLDAKLRVSRFETIVIFAWNNWPVLCTRNMVIRDILGFMTENQFMYKMSDTKCISYVNLSFCGRNLLYRIFVPTMNRSTGEGDVLNYCIS
jgi:hypothetical protein